MQLARIQASLVKSFSIHDYPFLEDVQVLTEGATTTKGAHLSVASGSIPKFEPVDASVELWKYYLTQFTMFVPAKSFPNEKKVQVFLTNQSTTTYKLLCTMAGQQDPPEDINKLSIKSINPSMEQQYTTTKVL